jgi:hypothetical protein
MLVAIGATAADVILGAASACKLNNMEKLKGTCATRDIFVALIRF